MAKERDNGNGARMVRNIIGAISVTAVCLVLWLCMRGCGGRTPHGSTASGTTAVRTDTITIRDTVWLPAPVADTERRTGTAIAMVTLAAPGGPALPQRPDSALAALPVVQRHYGDSLYDAWVSGPAAGDARPALDSLRIYPARQVVTNTVTVRSPPRRWGISIGAGMVATPTRIEPGIFVGVTYTFATL